MVSQLCLMCGSTLNCQTLCLGARPLYNLVVDQDVKKPTNQPALSLSLYLLITISLSMSVSLCFPTAFPPLRTHPQTSPSTSYCFTTHPQTSPSTSYCFTCVQGCILRSALIIFSFCSPENLSIPFAFSGNIQPHPTPLSTPTPSPPHQL